MMCVRTHVRIYVSVTLRNVEVTSRWNVAVSRCACGLRIGIRNVTCAYVRRGPAVGARSRI